MSSETDSTIYFIKPLIRSWRSCFKCRLYLPMYFIIWRNVVNNLASTFRQLELRFLGVKITEAYSESCQTSKMVLFVKIVNSLQCLTIFAKSFIFNVWQGWVYLWIALLPGKNLIFHTYRVVFDFMGLHQVSLFSHSDG